MEGAIATDEARDPADWKVGVDIGGTFIDFCALEARSGRVASLKVLTTPEDPGAEFHRDGEGRPRTVHQHHREVLRLLDEGGVRCAVQRMGHVFGRRAGMVRQNLKVCAVKQGVTPRRSAED
jgi:hypothetical protein